MSRAVEDFLVYYNDFLFTHDETREAMFNVNYEGSSFESRSKDRQRAIEAFLKEQYGHEYRVNMIARIDVHPY